MEENRTLAQMAEKNFDVKQFDLSSLEPQLDFKKHIFIRFCTIAADIKSKIFPHSSTHGGIQRVRKIHKSSKNLSKSKSATIVPTVHQTAVYSYLCIIAM